MLKDPGFLLMGALEPLVVFAPKEVLALHRRFAKPSRMFECNGKVVRAAALHRLGRLAESKRMLEAAIKAAKPQFRRASRHGYQRYLTQFKAADAAKKK